MQSITRTWVELALSDLKSSQVLYEKGHYRTSYFLFQQAAEKANKAFGLENGIIVEKDLQNIGHNQLKIYRKFIAEQELDLKNLIDITIDVSPKIKSKHQELRLNLSEIDSLKNKDLINISSLELNKLYKELNLFRFPLHKRMPYKGILEKVKLKSNEAHIFWKFAFQMVGDIYFIGLTFGTCALLTIQHVSSTRYPDNGKNPAKIYISKLPLIKKQPLFMDLLREALTKMKKNKGNEQAKMFSRLSSKK
jgi:hypothetical protein